MSNCYIHSNSSSNKNEIKRLFEEKGVYPKKLEDTLSQCVEKGWIIDCGNGNYTR